MSTLKFNHSKIRFDLQIIASWIKPHSRVLDLGCGEGDLLLYLKKHKNVVGTGIEHDEAKVAYRRIGNQLLGIFLSGGNKGSVHDADHRQGIEQAGDVVEVDRRLGGELVDRVEGSWTNVVGLPLEPLGSWLGRIGIDLRRLAGTTDAGED